MKKSMLFLSALAISGNVFSAVDYSYCQKQFNTYSMPNKPCETKFGIFSYCSYGGNTTKSGESSYFPFELTEDGKIKAHPTLNYKNENGKEIISSADKSMGYESIITRNDKGEITGVTTSYSMKNGFGGMYGPGVGGGKQQLAKNVNSFERKNETNVKLEIKNGKCIPSRVDSVNSLGDESRQDVNFDAKLCRNVAQFFKKNPEAASCFDKNLMESAQNIFNDFYKDNKDIYGDVKPDGFSVPKAQRTKLKSQLNQGYGFPGTGAMGGYGMGMGMGMPGATTDQMLTPMMATVDSVLSAPKFGLATGGFGSSPVVSAMQILTLCQGGGFGPNVLHDVIYDESVWKTESADSKEDTTTNTTK